MVKPYDALVKNSLVDTYADDLARDINNILILVIGVIIIVLAFTSKSFAEVIVFLLVFGAAALLNMGTNFFFGTISFISNSVCVILQLALAIDYAIILSFCRRKSTRLSSKRSFNRSTIKSYSRNFWLIINYYFRFACSMLYDIKAWSGYGISTC